VIAATDAQQLNAVRRSIKTDQGFDRHAGRGGRCRQDAMRRLRSAAACARRAGGYGQTKEADMQDLLLNGSLAAIHQAALDKKDLPKPNNGEFCSRNRAQEIETAILEELGGSDFTFSLAR